MCQTITVYRHSCHHRYNHRYHHRWARWVVTLAAGRHCPVSSSFFATPQPGPILFDAIMISKIILTGLFLFVYAPATTTITTIPVRSLSNVRAVHSHPFPVRCKAFTSTVFPCLSLCMCRSLYGQKGRSENWKINAQEASVRGSHGFVHRHRCRTKKKKKKCLSFCFV